jgi:hypothetical protein
MRKRITPASLEYSTNTLRNITSKRLIIKVMLSDNYKIISEKIIGIRE